jgi:hypothetical protein
LNAAQASLSQVGETRQEGLQAGVEGCAGGLQFCLTPALVELDPIFLKDEQMGCAAGEAEAADGTADAMELVLGGRAGQLSGILAECDEAWLKVMPQHVDDAAAVLLALIVLLREPLVGEGGVEDGWAGINLP